MTAPRSAVQRAGSWTVLSNLVRWKTWTCKSIRWQGHGVEDVRSVATRDSVG